MTPQVSVFIPTYLDHNDAYLRKAVESVLSQDIPVEVIVISDRKEHPRFDDPRVKILALPHRTRFCPKNNLAASVASKDSEYFLLLNDDAYQTRGCLTRMVSAAKTHNDDCLVGAISNCDNGPLYRTHMEVPLMSGGKLTVPPQFSIKEAEPWFDSLFEYQPFVIPFSFEVPRLFFYNTLIPRKVWDSVGPMDEAYLNSCDDFDYCIRAKKLGYKLIIEQSSFCFHFSGKTSGVTATSKERIEDQQYIMKKHGSDYWRVG